MKEYQVTTSRTYVTKIQLKFPDDGRDHIKKINECLELCDEDIWDLIAEKELEQMHIYNYDWEIHELTDTEQQA